MHALAGNYVNQQLQLGVTTETLQSLGIYHGSFVQIHNSANIDEKSAAIACVLSLDSRDHLQLFTGKDQTSSRACVGHSSVETVDQLDQLPHAAGGTRSSSSPAERQHPPRRAQAQAWQHHTAYLSPLLAFNLGFQPQLTPFLQPHLGQHSPISSQPKLTHNAQHPDPSKDACQSASSGQSPQENVTPRNSQLGRHHAHSAAGESEVRQQHESRPLSHHELSASQTGVQARQGPVDGPDKAASDLQLCPPDEPWWAWVGGNVSVQPLQVALHTADKQPKSMVSLQNPGKVSIACSRGEVPCWSFHRSNLLQHRYFLLVWQLYLCSCVLFSLQQILYRRQGLLLHDRLNMIVIVSHCLCNRHAPAAGEHEVALMLRWQGCYQA